jgi:hypothetical protein
MKANLVWAKLDWNGKMRIQINKHKTQEEQNLLSKEAEMVGKF